jgi:hypothetical protein
MEKVVITSLYNEIIDYFKPEMIEDDDFEFLDKWETVRETLKNYLSKHFRYLMKNVFYLDMKNYRAKGSKGSYYIYEKDAPIFYEILLHSVSQNEHDLIIRQWLNGKIKYNDYYAITELSDRLFPLILNNEKATSEVKESWIEVLSIVLRTDLAYTMMEVEFTIGEIFSRSLPFKVNEKIPINDADKTNYEICDSFLKDKIVNQFNAYDMQAQNSRFNIVYNYLQDFDYNILNDAEAFPPIELMKLKSIFEMPFTLEILKPILKNYDKIEEYIEYFKSIDKDFRKKQEHQKELDRERYRKNNIAKALGLR